MRLVDRDWGRELAELMADSHRLRVICPFIKQGALWRVVGDVIPADTRVITRFSLQDFSSGVSDIAALQDVLEAGGQVRGIRGLHAKVFIFGNRVAAVTSANLTQRGLRHNAEFGCVSGDSGFVTACNTYFDALWSEGRTSVKAESLAEWQAAVTAFLLTAAPQGRRLSLPDYGIITPTALEVGHFTEADGITDASPTWLSEATHGYVKFFGQGHERSPWDRPVLDEVSSSGSHRECTYPKNRRPRQVRDGDVMYLAAMVEGPDDYLIYGRAAALAHVDGRDDASAPDIAARPWRERWPHYVRVHDAEFIAGTLANGIRLSTLMETLNAESFASTQKHASAGHGANTNPRMALRQQPAVKLSQQGLAWLNDRFDAALRQHGRLPVDQLANLDWPSTTWPTFTELLAAKRVRAEQLWTQVKHDAASLPSIVADIRALAAHIGLEDPNDTDFRRSVGHFSQGKNPRTDRPLQQHRAALVRPDDSHHHSGDSRYPA